MTNVERQLIEGLKLNEKITNVKVFKDKVVFDIEKPIAEFNERMTKTNPTEEFIQALKRLEGM